MQIEQNKKKDKYMKAIERKHCFIMSSYRDRDEKFKNIQKKYKIKFKI